MTLRTVSLVGLAQAMLLLAGSVAAAAPEVPATPVQRRMAITIDDLPWATLGDETPPQMAVYHARLIAALREARAPVIGFVNEGKLISANKVDTSRVHMLRDWLDAGLDLGNHTQNHADLHAVREAEQGRFGPTTPAVDLGSIQPSLGVYQFF